MSLISDVGHLGRILDSSSVRSGQISAKASLRLAGLADGKMSSYIRQHQDAVSYRHSNLKKRRATADSGASWKQHGPQGVTWNDRGGQSIGV